MDLGCLNRRAQFYFYSLSFLQGATDIDYLFLKKKNLLKVFGNAKDIGLERNYCNNSQMYLETLR